MSQQSRQSSQLKLTNIPNDMLYKIAESLPSRNIEMLKGTSKHLHKTKGLNNVKRKKLTMKKGGNAIRRIVSTVGPARKNNKTKVGNREWMLQAKMPSLLRIRGIKNHPGSSRNGRRGRGPNGELPWGRNWADGAWEFNHWRKRDWALYRLYKAIQSGDPRRPSIIFKELMAKEPGPLAMNGGY